VPVSNVDEVLREALVRSPFKPAPGGKTSKRRLGTSAPRQLV
jgi:hypothetical protein